MLARLQALVICTLAFISGAHRMSGLSGSADKFASGHFCADIVSTTDGVSIIAACSVESFAALSRINALINSKRIKLVLKKKHEEAGLRYYEVQIPKKLLIAGLSFEAVKRDGTVSKVWVPLHSNITLPPRWSFSRYHLLLQYGQSHNTSKVIVPHLEGLHVNEGTLHIEVVVFSNDPGVMNDAKAIAFRFRADEAQQEFPLIPSNSTEPFGISLSSYSAYTDCSAFPFTVSIPLSGAFDRSALYSVMLLFANEPKHIRPRLDAYEDSEIVLENQDYGTLTLVHPFSDPIARDLRIEIFRFASHEADRARTLLKPKAWEGRDPVWLFGEYPNTARDNGWALFQHAQTSCPEIDPWYVISLPNADGVRPIDSGVLIYGTIEHLEACRRAQAVLFSHHAVYIYPDMMRVLNKKRGLQPVLHFLQHGVLAIKPMLNAYKKGKHKYDLFNVSSARERSLVVKTCGWAEKDVVISGLPRWDALTKRDERFASNGGKPSRILMFPTWRPIWDKLPYKYFLEAPFYHKWREAIASVEATASEHGIAVDFCLHSVFERYRDAFADMSTNVITMREAIEKLPEYLALVTDYSSLCFDFLYLDKPSIFFMFDRDEYFAKSKPYIDVEKELPGPIAPTVEELAGIVSAVLTNGVSHNIDRGKFVRRDVGNCRRVIEQTSLRVTKQTFVAVERAARAKDYDAVRRYSRPFRERKLAKGAFNNDVINILAASIEASLMLGAVPEAIATMHYAERLYGTPSQLSLAGVAIHRLQGNFAAAEAAVDIALCAVPAKRGASADDLVAIKADILLSQGKAENARNLIARNLGNIHGATVFELLARSITQLDELGEFESIVLPQLGNLGSDARHALHHYALLLLRMEKADQAIAIARECFFTVTRSLPFGAERNRANPLGIQRVETAVSDLVSDLRNFESRIFLIGRTLLRYARGESVTGNIDIGVEQNVPAQALRDALGRSMRFSLLDTESENFISLRHVNGCRIDIFRHYLRAGRVFRETDDVHWWNTPFTLTKIDFLNLEIDAPSDPEVYLTEAYGDWRRNKDDFDDLIDTRNLIAARPQHAIAHYLLRLTEYYLAGKRGALGAARARLASVYSHDQLLLDTLRRVTKAPELFRGSPKLPAKKPGPVTKPAPSRNPETAKKKSESLWGLAPLSAAERASAPAPIVALVRYMLRMPLSGRAAMLQTRRLKEMLDAQPGNASLRKQFETTAMRAGHDNIHAGRYEDASKVFYSLRGVSEDRQLANRNLSSAALKGARQAEAAGDKKKALTFWRYLQKAQPHSDVAAQGIARCS